MMFCQRVPCFFWWVSFHCWVSKRCLASKIHFCQQWKTCSVSDNMTSSTSSFLSDFLTIFLSNVAFCVCRAWGTSRTGRWNPNMRIAFELNSNIIKVFINNGKKLTFSSSQYRLVLCLDTLFCSCSCNAAALLTTGDLAKAFLKTPKY